MDEHDIATDVAWDLSDLYGGADDPRVIADLDAVLAGAQRFASRYRGHINAAGGPDPGVVAAAVAELEVLLERTDKPCAYADLLHAADTTVAAHGALLARTQELASAVRQQLLFFELEWLALDDAAAARVLAHPDCRRHRHFLSRLRRYRPHVLSEAEEKVLEDKANTGARAFARLFDELLSAMTFTVEIDGQQRRLTESALLALLYEPQRAVRRAAAAALTRSLRDHELVLGFILNTILQDHASDDRLRRYPDPMAARHLANEIRTETVETLMRACESRHDLVHRYYRLKSRLLGIAPLADYDRYAPVDGDSPVLDWDQCRDLVLTAYGVFAPAMRDVAAQFFARRWIDAAPRPGKRGGAFSAATVPSVHPYVLLNYTGRLHDVMTLAHELGHGVHQYLSRPQGYLQADTPLTMAETASVFGEMLVFDHLRRQVTDAAARLRLLCSKIEDSIATVFRQVALTRFEQRVHQARRTQGELSRDDVCSAWMDVNAALYGDAVTLTDDYRWWWAYIPHFVHTPFYCYAYGFGELLVLALYARYRQEGAAFVPHYLELLAAGGSGTPEDLLRGVGIDVNDPDFWRLGLDPLREMIDEAEALAGV